MGPKQQALAETVPQFIDATWSALPLESEIHVGLTTELTGLAIGCFPDGVADL